jgi:hypothetical protein
MPPMHARNESDWRCGTGPHRAFRWLLAISAAWIAAACTNDYSSFKFPKGQIATDARVADAGDADVQTD